MSLVVINRRRDGRRVRPRTGRIQKAAGDDVLALADSVAPGLRRQVSRLLRLLTLEFQRQVSESGLVALIDAGDTTAIEEALTQVLSSEVFTRQSTEILSEFEVEFQIGSDATTEGLTRVIDSEFKQTLRRQGIRPGSARYEQVMTGLDTLNIKGRLAFDRLNPRVVELLNNRGLLFQQRIQSQSIRTVQRVVRDGILRQLTAEQLADELRQVVSLTERQRLGMKKLGDSMRQAGRTRRQIKDAQRAYRERAIWQRADTIARTETVRIQNEARELQWRRAIDDGILGTATRREWVVTRDDRLCNFCRPMGGKLTGINEPWITEMRGREAWTPQDIHPRCRCTERLIEIELGPRLAVDDVDNIAA